MNIEIISVDGLPMIKKGDSIVELILDNFNAPIENGDILLIAETVISKSIGNFIDLNTIEAGEEAHKIAKATKKEPELIQLILNESNEVVVLGSDFIITETKDGFVCANAGIDESNIEYGFAKPLPPKPDSIAKQIREDLEKKTNKKLGVIITDTQGRAFRNGAVGVAIGSSGILSLWSRKGEKDLYGRTLQTSEIGIADELASAASLLMGQADEGIPVVIIRGFEPFNKIRNTEDTCKSLLMSKEKDVFRK